MKVEKEKEYEQFKKLSLEKIEKILIIEMKIEEEISLIIKVLSSGAISDKMTGFKEEEIMIII